MKACRLKVESLLKSWAKALTRTSTETGKCPSPSRSPNVSMPSNRDYAMNGLLRTFKRKPHMEKDYIRFMSRIITKGHSVEVPHKETSPSKHPGQIWYLPHFEVYLPKKPDQIRVVFDSSAEYQGKSLNRELLTGPDLMNSLL